MRMSIRAFNTAAFAAVLALAASVQQYAQSQQLNGNETTKLIKEVGETAAKTSAEVESLGKSLLAVLGDEKRSIRERTGCALVLGKLRYLPAIPKLIELIDVRASLNEVPDGRELLAEIPSHLDSYPCMRALVNYGELAVPDITTAYLKQENKRNELKLAILLELGDVKTSKTYLQGLLMEGPDHRSKMELLELVSYLQRRDKDCPPYGPCEPTPRDHKRGSDDKPTPLEVSSGAVRQAAATEARGKKWLATLNDKTKSGKERAESALVLGKLRYTPAIPKLIELIDMQFPEDGPGKGELPAEGRPQADTLPCLRALVDFAELAVPDVADAYLQERDKGRQQRLARVFELGNVKTSRIYLQGLLMEKPEHRAKMRLLELVTSLQQKDKP